LLGTGLDRSALTRAQARGPYSADDTRGVSSAQRARYFEAGGPPHFVTERLARRVTFKEHNLLASPFEQGFDLIVCRNVVIYFTETAKSGLYRKFQEALRPGGLLFVGGTEIIPQARDLGLRSTGIAFYQKV
jgi:chemotaxis protein methyltransferase CheR